jgi:gluconokinase
MKSFIVIIMGVSGCGKSTVGRLFAERSGARFVEGDDFHPAENVEKMSRGIPLDDRDREGWLRVLAGIVAKGLAEGDFVVLSCSALKKKYRDQLSGGDLRVRFVHLAGSIEMIEERLRHRKDHFMPPTLLKSQFDILEAPEDAVVVSFEKPPEVIVDELVKKLG